LRLLSIVEITGRRSGKGKAAALRINVAQAERCGLIKVDDATETAMV
jgi:hypothetical protein